MIVRFLVSFTGVLFVGSTGAFFLLVPILSIVTVCCMVAGLMLMFGLGFQAGSRSIPLSESLGKQTWDRSAAMLRLRIRNGAKDALLALKTVARRST